MYLPIFIFSQQLKNNINMTFFFIFMISDLDEQYNP